MSALRRRSFGGIVAVLAGLTLAFQFPTAAYAADVAIDATNFPDANFRAYVARFDANSDGSLQQDEVGAVTEIDVTGKSIRSLKGVEHFTKLKRLFAGGNQLTAVDVSANTNLTRIALNNNQLTTVDLSHNTNLRELFLEGNQLTTVDLSHNTNLTELYLNNNKLTAVDLKANTNLQMLQLNNNQLTAVDVSHNPNLIWLQLNNNKLTAVDLSANPNLAELRLNNNKLTAVDLNTGLIWLSLANNQLTAVDLSDKYYLQTLNLSGNQLTAVHLRESPNLEQLDLSNNQLTAVDLSDNHYLQTLNLSHNQLTALDLSANTQLDGDYADLGDQGRAVRLPESSRLVPVDQLSVGFDTGKVSDLVGATIVDGQLKVNEGASTVTYNYATDNDTKPSMPVTLQVTAASGYTVSFDMGGHGSQVADQKVAKGEKAKAPAAPTAKGWDFKGWYTDNTFATPFDFTKPINADMTVHAKWEKAASKPTGKSTTKPTNTTKEVTPEGTAITGADSSWFALLGAAAITAGGLLLLRRRT